uniref:baseplate assembly protein n=1 Tax=uncultured Bilophila sp. TaxID=529385 RepID=UPI0025D05464|nr:baseplate J/gp47 family protein [uncultured Bilophila sp.]
MSLLDDFAAVDFSGLTPSEIETLVINAYETASGNTVYPGDPVRLFLESNAYVISLLVAYINETGRQQFLAHAVGPHLDLIGAMVDTARLPASAARTVLRFSVAEALAWPVFIPQGTRVNTGDGNTELTFATDETATISAGALSADVPATCMAVGAQGNGLVSGQLNRLVDPLAYVADVRNVETSRLGADIEDDAGYQARIRLAPERFSVAGPTGAYRYHALAVHQGISDVAVWCPTPGTVDVRPVMTGGELPPENILEMVRERLSAEDVRPLTDTVIVAAPEPVEYAVAGTWWLRKADEPLAASVTKAVEAALEEYRVWQRSAPGRDINPTRLIALLERAGAKRVELASPAYLKLEKRQIARETAINLMFMGIEDD